jgi:hypothetical protein
MKLRLGSSVGEINLQVPNLEVELDLVFHRLDLRKASPE